MTWNKRFTKCGHCGVRLTEFFIQMQITFFEVLVVKHKKPQLRILFLLFPNYILLYVDLPHHMSVEYIDVFGWSEVKYGFISFFPLFPSLLQILVDNREEGPFLLRLDCVEVRCRTGNKTFRFSLKTS